MGPMVAEPHPLLCLVALRRTGLMAEEEVVPRWPLANWATALTVSVLASMHTATGPPSPAKLAVGPAVRLWDSNSFGRPLTIPLHIDFLPINPVLYLTV